MLQRNPRQKTRSVRVSFLTNFLAALVNMFFYMHLMQCTNRELKTNQLLQVSCFVKTRRIAALFVSVIIFFQSWVQFLCHPSDKL